jgi:UDP-glucose 4-epimerase
MTIFRFMFLPWPQWEHGHFGVVHVLMSWDMTWLVTGGAGYIVHALVDEGLPVVVLDDLSTGLRNRVPADVPLVKGNVLEQAKVVDVMHDYRVHGVIHLAGKKAVGESVEQPLLYYRENVGGFASLLEAMLEARVDRLLLSSSCSVIGTPESETVTEDSPTRPESPYGETKLVCEWLLRDVRRSTGMRDVILRYFNVAGARTPGLSDLGKSNLIPLIFWALSEGRAPAVFGDDYDTRDGSCIRDYVDVVDVARAHVAAVRRLEAGDCDVTYNVGRGEGSTVKEVMQTVRQVVGRDFDYVITERRPGDPAKIVGAVDKIRYELGWVAQYDLEHMVRSAWKGWLSRFPS